MDVMKNARSFRFLVGILCSRVGAVRLRAVHVEKRAEKRGKTKKVKICAFKTKDVKRKVSNLVMWGAVN